MINAISPHLVLLRHQEGQSVLNYAPACCHILALNILFEMHYFKPIKVYGCWIRASSECTSKRGGHKELFGVEQWMRRRSDELLDYFGPAVFLCAAGQLAHKR